MIKIDKTEVVGFDATIRGMRNPMNSWEKSDSTVCTSERMCSVCEENHTDQCYNGFVLGDNDHQLMMSLAKQGPVHAKYRRMITVYTDILAPLYWWKEYDTYKVGTVANSCSTMHKIHAKEFTLDDFSHEHLTADGESILLQTLDVLNAARREFVGEEQPENKGDKTFWWQMIQLLPTSYNQKRTVELNYEVLAGIYQNRRNHKLDEWRDFCKWIEELPYSEVITLDT